VYPAVLAGLETVVAAVVFIYIVTQQIDKPEVPELLLNAIDVIFPVVPISVPV
jgi:hypothetical protein